MAYIPTSITNVLGNYAISAYTGIPSTVLTDLTTVGGAAYDWYNTLRNRQASDFDKGLASAQLVNSIAGLATPLAPFAALQAIANVQLGLAHSYFAKQEAKHAARHAVHKVTRELVRLQNLGHNTAIAARLAAASRHLDPELVAPLGSPWANFNPRTGFSDTEIGLLLDFGEGDVGDAARAARSEELQREFERRPIPFPGAVPMPFSPLRRVA